MKESVGETETTIKQIYNQTQLNMPLQMNQNNSKLKMWPEYYRYNNSNQIKSFLADMHLSLNI